MREGLQHGEVDMSSFTCSDMRRSLDSVTHHSFQEVGRCQLVETEMSMFVLESVSLQVDKRAPTSCHLAVTSRYGRLNPNVH